MSKLTADPLKNLNVYVWVCQSMPLGAAHEREREGPRERGSRETKKDKEECKRKILTSARYNT
jgi:hypothetical protein